MSDLFDSSLNLEEQFIEEGRQEGIRCGRRDGLRDGINLGIDKGFEIGSELGYYEGAVKTWLALQRSQPLFSERIERAMISLKEIIDSFPIDPQDERLQDAMSDLRGKFKAIVAMTGMKDVYLPDTQTPQNSIQF